VSIDSANSGSSRKQTLQSLVLGLLPRSSSVVVAVSGGLDSMVLLSLVHSVSVAHELNVTAAHFHHGLRSQSDTEAAMVEEFCKENAIRYRQGRPNSPFSEGNLEEWARRVRYFLEEVRTEQQAETILTAHTRDDVIETFFIKLLSNKELSTIERIDERRHVARPLIEVSRQELESYAAENKLPYAVDSSNYSLARLRNRIRHHLLPFLYQEFGQHLRATLAESAFCVATDIESLHELYGEGLAESTQHLWGSKQWLRGVQHENARHPKSVRWRFVEAALLPKVGFKIGRRAATRVSKFLESTSPRVQLPGGYSLVRRGGEVAYERSSS
jgi:tRNA(Ile)-lysidine synthetase-like protein